MAGEDTTLEESLEFWPDHGPGPLWRPGGTPVDVTSLGLPGDLAERLESFNGAYTEDRLPLQGPGDVAYLLVGVRLLTEVRQALAGRFRVLVTEPWWDEPSSEHEPSSPLAGRTSLGAQLQP